jgi:hypothetical protein
MAKTENASKIGGVKWRNGGYGGVMPAKWRNVAWRKMAAWRK